MYFNDVVRTHFEELFPDKLIPCGRHEIPFEYRLLENLPSSYEGLYGHIRYLCCATLVRSWKFDITCKKAFTVVAHEDLNRIPGVNLPVQLTEAQELFCCCFKRGMVGLNFRLPKRGYVPGESIPVWCEISNNSRSPIRHVLVTLKQYVTFRGKTLILSYNGTKEMSLEVTHLFQPTAIPPGETTELSLHFTVPPVPPRLIGCNIIDINYLLKFNVGAYIRCRIPVIIGTIPLRQRMNDNQDNNISLSRGLIPPVVYGDDQPPQYQETPPPTYRECILGNFQNTIDDSSNEEDNEGSSDQISFVPKYVFYKNV